MGSRSRLATAKRVPGPFVLFFPPIPGSPGMGRAPAAPGMGRAPGAGSRDTNQPSVTSLEPVSLQLKRS